MTQERKKNAQKRALIMAQLNPAAGIKSEDLPSGSAGGFRSLSQSDRFLIPKLHKILLRSVEFMRTSWMVNVSILRLFRLQQVQVGFVSAGPEFMLPSGVRGSKSSPDSHRRSEKPTAPQVPPPAPLLCALAARAHQPSEPSPPKSSFSRLHARFDSCISLLVKV